MIANTWGDVWGCAAALGTAVASRLHAYWPAERARRAARARMLRRFLDDLAREPDEEELDAVAVSEFVTADGDIETTKVWGIDERQEIAINRAVAAFRTEVEEIMGGKVWMDISLATLDRTADEA